MIVVTNTTAIRDLIFRSHNVFFAKDGEIVEDWYDPDQFDIIVVDIDTACGLRSPLMIRNANRSIPIIGLSEKCDAESRATFLENGGCYLLQKPFDRREMLAVINGVNNRVGERVKIKLYGGRFVLRAADMMAVFDNTVVKLTPSEMKIMIELARNFGRPVSREKLLKVLLAPHEEEPPEINTVDVYVAKIRRKLNSLEKGAQLGHHCINTVWGVGYCLVDVEPAEQVQN